MAPWGFRTTQITSKGWYHHITFSKFLLVFVSVSCRLYPLSKRVLFVFICAFTKEKTTTRHCFWWASTFFVIASLSFVVRKPISMCSRTCVRKVNIPKYPTLTLTIRQICLLPEDYKHIYKPIILYLSIINKSWRANILHWMSCVARACILLCRHQFTLLLKKTE